MSSRGGGQDLSPIPVVLVADGKYRVGLEATKASIVASAARPERLQFHELDETALPEGALDRFGAYYGSKLPMLRLFLGDILPNDDWAVYVDVDTLWFRDVEELWAERDDRFSLAWCRDLPSTRRSASRWIRREVDPSFDDSNYCCSGLILMNLRKMRETRFSERAAEFVAKHGTPPYPDQDVLNVLAAHDAKYLDGRWNVIRSEAGALEKGAVYHLCGIGRQFGGEPRGRLPQFEGWWNFLAGIRGDRDLAEKVRRAYPLRLKAAWFAMGALPLWRIPLPSTAFCDRLRRALFFAWLRLRGGFGRTLR